VITVLTIMTMHCVLSQQQHLFVRASKSARVVGAFVPLHHRQRFHPRSDPQLVNRFDRRLASGITNGLFTNGFTTSMRHYHNDNTNNKYHHHNHYVGTSTRLHIRSTSSSPLSQPSIHLDPSSPSSYDLPPSPSSSSIHSLRPNRRIVAIGDVHGDLPALQRFLFASNILHPSSTYDNPIWGGGDTIVVQCGDILDRGGKELACIRVLTSLARQAAEAGGEIILLHGNHEALNAVGMYRYVTGNEVENDLEPSFDRNGGPDWKEGYGKNRPARWATFEPGGFLSEPLYQKTKVAVVLGRTVFVHAGLTAEHVRYYGSLDQMNAAAAEWFADSDYHTGDYGVRTTDVGKDTGPAERRYAAASRTLPPCLGGTLGGAFETATSPVWMRDYSSPADRPPSAPTAQSSINAALKSLGGDVRRMVMGHTPQTRINAALGGKAWRIDVGASQGVRGGVPEVLEIVHDGAGEGEDRVSVLTMEGIRIPSERRMLRSGQAGGDLTGIDL